MASLSTRSRRGTEPEFELNDRVDHITKKKPSSGETKNDTNETTNNKLSTNVSTAASTTTTAKPFKVTKEDVLETKPRFTVTRADILYYLEHYDELPSGGNIKKRKKAMKKIKKRKQEKCGNKLKRSQVSSFVIRVMTIVEELKEKELSGDELNKEIDILFKPRTPSPPSSSEEEVDEGVICGGLCNETIYENNSDNAYCDRCDKLFCQHCIWKCGDWDCRVKYCESCEKLVYVGGDTCEFLSCRHN